MTSPIPNLFKVPELKEKLLFTLLCLVVYRVGAHIATPGVNVDALADYLANAGSGTLFGLYDLFAVKRLITLEEAMARSSDQDELKTMIANANAQPGGGGGQPARR